MTLQRIYQTLLAHHLSAYSQMAFVSGPRQVGKTTVARDLSTSYSPATYLNWDIPSQRQIILDSHLLIQELSLKHLRDSSLLVLFDELYKFKKWKNFLKGLFDSYHEQLKIVVTGSARLDIYRSGQDSLMGRYFLYRVHPLSLAECQNPRILPSKESLFKKPIKPDPGLLKRLLRFGGFPEPFLKEEEAFHNKWRAIRRKQMLYEDIRDLSQIHEIAQLEVLCECLRAQAGSIFNRTTLSKKIQVTVQTITRWISVLEQFFYCFSLKPYSRNVQRALIKEPKLYLWDWSLVDDPGARFENLVASHLYKAVHLWTDQGLGEFDLFFIRDKDQREVDFLVTQDGNPLLLVEAKSSDAQRLSPHLQYFQEKLQVKYAFQVVASLPYVDKDPFTVFSPFILPAETFLSSLV